MITDISDAGASATSQSHLVMMHDQVAISLTAFSHVTGAANEVYMDGHVDFMKYLNKLRVTGDYPLLIGYWWRPDYSAIGNQQVNVSRLVRARPDTTRVNH